MHDHCRELSNVKVECLIYFEINNHELCSELIISTQLLLAVIVHMLKIVHISQISMLISVQYKVQCAC